MSYTTLVQQLLPLLGGKENIISATHCATRLRLVVKNEALVNKGAIEQLPEAKGAFASSGQFQIIFGTGVVNQVHEAFMKEVGELSTDHQAAVQQNLNPFARLAKVLSNIFVPIIPAIVASGLLMGLLGMLKAFKWVTPDSALFLFLDMFSSAAFIILPILIGYSAAKEFGGNQVLGAVIGGIMTHPALLNPWTLGNAKPNVTDFFGLKVELIGYQGTVIPVLLAVFVMSIIEKNIRKRVPQAIDLLVTPFLTVILTGLIAILAIGPLGTLIGKGITATLTTVYDVAGPLAGLVFGGLYSLIVITGVHHSFHAIEANILAELGKNYLLPIWSMANVAQGGAGLAVFFKTRQAKTKEVALPAAMSAFLGITEPVMFGVNLKYRKPFIAAAIGGAVGSAYVVGMNVVANAYGLTGIPMMTIVAPFGMTNLVHYLIGFALSVGVAFVLTYVLKWQEDDSK